MIRISNNVSFGFVEDEVLIYLLPEKKYYSLQKTGAEIWKMIAYGLPIKEIISQLESKYGKTAQVEDDIIEFIFFLKKEGLVNG